MQPRRRILGNPSVPWELRATASLWPHLKLLVLWEFGRQQRPSLWCRCTTSSSRTKLRPGSSWKPRTVQLAAHQAQIELIRPAIVVGDLAADPMPQAMVVARNYRPGGGRPVLAPPAAGGNICGLSADIIRYLLGGVLPVGRL